MSTKFIIEISRGKHKTNPWFSHSCSDFRNTVKNYEKLVNKHPSNSKYRKMFYTYKAKCRRLCKFEELIYGNKIFNAIYKNNNNNPKSFLNY